MPTSCNCGHIFTQQSPFCPQCGRAAPRPSFTPEPKRTREWLLPVVSISAVIIVAAVATQFEKGRDRRQPATAASPSPSRTQLTTEHVNVIRQALKAKGYPAPTLTVSDGGFLVATFELQHLPQQSFRRYAEDALLIIRNAMLPFNAFQNYRVTLNGPSPGPGLIRRYGNARFIEGGSVTWEPAE